MDATRPGNWDCGFCELADGTWLVNLTITGFFKRGVKPERRLLERASDDASEWGDWTWAYKTQGLARHLRGQVAGPRHDLERADPGQRPPAQARRLPPRLLAAALRARS